MVQKESQPPLKTIGLSVSQWPIILAVAMAIPAGAVSLYSIAQFQATSGRAASAPPKKAPAIIAVTGLGRLEPQGEVIKLSAPQYSTGVRVGKLLVKEGDKVSAGQPIAILDVYEERLAAVKQAQEQIKVSQTKLYQVKAGNPPGEIAAQKATIAQLQAEYSGQVATQKATIARLEAQLKNAQTESRRNQMLYQQGAISASAYDSKRLAEDTYREQLNEATATERRTVQTLQEQIRQAKGTLDAKAEVRPVDVQAAQAQVDNAIASAQQAKADADLAVVRSPIDGQILKIDARPGELVDSKGIARLGHTDQMYAAAEIYETDIGKVRIGQRATITSAAFPAKLQGTVVEIGKEVKQQDVLSINPTSDTDQKVVKVRVRIDGSADNQMVSSLTNLQVQVAIHI